MTKREKLLQKAQNNPKGLSFADFKLLLAQSGWQRDRQVGSHAIWYSPKGHRISVQEANNGKAKGYQVEQFLAQYEVENGNG
jgi:predicted RNA binding protein YcfA (HicA-like mRNA interferase family)